MLADSLTPFPNAQAVELKLSTFHVDECPHADTIPHGGGRITAAGSFKVIPSLPIGWESSKDIDGWTPPSKQEQDVENDLSEIILTGRPASDKSPRAKVDRKITSSRLARVIDI